MYSVCHVVFQTDGDTPLYIACQNDHLECARALLGAGAAVNQATVGCARLMALHYESCVRVDMYEPASIHVWLVGLASMRCC